MNKNENAKIKKKIEDVYTKLKNKKGGKVASYIPELSKQDPNLYAISVCTVDGEIIHVGDTRKLVAIESVSKVFTLALALKERGYRALKDLIGIEHSDKEFNSIQALIDSKTHTMNPFVNAGAMATTSLLYEPNKRQFIKTIVDNMSDYAGRKLHISEEIYKSESLTNHHNKAIANLLKSYDRFYGDVDDTVDVYTAQCSVLVNTDDLSLMAATFANQGINPKTKKRVIYKKLVPFILQEMENDGLYEGSIDWHKRVGLPAKSGVSGILIIVIPGKMGIAIVSPQLNAQGNSYKGIKTMELLRKEL